MVTAGRQPDLCHQGFEVPSPLEVVGHVEGEGGVEVGSQGERGRASGQEGDRCLQGASFELLLKNIVDGYTFQIAITGISEMQILISTTCAGQVKRYTCNKA